jgi:hypothetical protein
MMTKYALFMSLTALASPAVSQTNTTSARVPDKTADDQRTFDPSTGDIVVFGRAENLIGVAGAASEGHVGRADFETRPLQRVGELLEVVPGLIVTQHSGSGKANQYFLRGFNLDHGTDFAGFLDGVPLNFRSHGHGQGYLDLNPIIPETIEYIDYRKGPYRADVGDFASAGSGYFNTYDAFAHPFATAEVGSFGYRRGLIGGSFKLAGGTALGVIEGQTNNTAYLRKEHLRHINAFAKWTGDVGNGTLRASIMGYHATFDSTDQIPLRAVQARQVPRLGFIDPTDGGETTRFGFTANWRENGDNPLHLLAYSHYYNFRLYSDFTYFLDNPVDGDQFKQVDRRLVTGGRVDKTLGVNVGGIPVELLAGVETRYDDIPRVEIYHTKARQITGTIRKDAVKEFSAGAFAEATIHPTSTIRFLLGAREDYYHFKDRSDIAINSGSRSASIFSPKASLAWAPVKQAEFYLNYGRGFHSNDARGTVIHVDPQSGDPVEPVNPLVRSVGEEVGVRLRPLMGLSLTATYWRLKLASELTFSGDGGTTQAQGPSARRGTEFALFYQPEKWITIDGEYTRSRARFTDQPVGLDRIPGAIEQVLAGGIVVQHGRFTASLRARHFGSFPLIEDNSRRSNPTTVVNGRLAHRFGHFQVSAEVINLLNSHDNDITYFYTSRLPGEQLEGVDDTHIHPIEPRAIRVSTTVHF